MRHSIWIVCLLCSLSCLSQGRNGRVTLSFENEDLEVIFDELSEQTGYLFSYNSDLLPKGSKYTISCTDMPVDQFLSELLIGTSLNYSFFKDQIIINQALPEISKRNKLFNLSGTVTDDKGQPLSDVNIFLDGTTIGTTSDIDGNYRIERIPAGYYDLVFSHVGYNNSVFNLSEYNGGARIQNHQMSLEISQLEEVEIVTDRIRKDTDRWPFYFMQFQNDLLGTSESSRYCSISNPEVIDFTYNEETNKLEAFASEPIKVVNEPMAYQITYYLESFERSDSDLRYRGQLKFQSDFGPGGEFSRRQVKQLRKQSYNGSWTHFKKSLLANRLRKDGFRIYETKSVTNINFNRLNELSASDIIVFKGNHWELDFKNYLLVVYGKERESLNFLLDAQFSSVIYGDLIDENDVLSRPPGKQLSLIKLLHGAVRLDLNGQVVDRFALSTFGYWSWERLANLVPLNYDPKFDNF